jgi:hypothetical protein
VFTSTAFRKINGVCMPGESDEMLSSGDVGRPPDVGTPARAGVEAELDCRASTGGKLETAARCSGVSAEVPGLPRRAVLAGSYARMSIPLLIAAGFTSGRPEALVLSLLVATVR